MNPKVVGLIIAIVVLLGIAAAVWFFFLRPSEPEASSTPLPVETIDVTPSPTASLNPGDQVAVLRPEQGQSGGGEASRSVSPGRFVLTVAAELPDLEAGKSYQVWLVRREPFAQFPAGNLSKSGNRWVMTLDQTRDASEYAEVVVTLESTLDTQPETRVLVGTFPAAAPAQP